MHIQLHARVWLRQPTPLPTMAAEVIVKMEQQGEQKDLQQLVNERWDKLCSSDEHPVSALDKFIGYEEDMAKVGIVASSLQTIRMSVNRVRNRDGPRGTERDKGNDDRHSTNTQTQTPRGPERGRGKRQGQGQHTQTDSTHTQT
jgi:hypothetical protein